MRRTPPPPDFTPDRFIPFDPRLAEEAEEDLRWSYLAIATALFGFCAFALVALVMEWLS